MCNNLRARARRALIALAAFGWLAAPAFAQVGIIGTQQLPTGCTTGQVPVYSTVTGLWSCGTSPTIDSLTFSGGQSLVGTTANVTDLRNGTSAQQLGIYNTYTSATNYERAVFVWGSNILFVGTQKGSGGGTARRMGLMTDDIERWTIGATTGHLTAGLDNTYDIGASGATRPRSIYAGTSVVTPLAAISSGNGGIDMRSGLITMGQSVFFGWTSSTEAGTVDTRWTRASAGVAQLVGTAGADTATVKSNAAQFTGLASVSGTRYVCSNTTGVLSGSASACSGTEPLIADFLKDGYVVLTKDEYADFQAMRSNWKAGAK